MEHFDTILNTPLVTIGETHLNVLQVLSMTALVILGGLAIVWIGRLLRARLTRRGVNPDVVQLTSRAWVILGFVILLVTVLETLKVPLTAFAFISGAVAIGVGFGAQNIINNFISGWILMWERPIKIGDFLELGDVKGSVEAINTRSTRIRRVDGVHLLVPNSYLLENTVTNWTLVDHRVRASVTVGVAYGSDVEKVTRLLNQAATEQEGVLPNPPHLVYFEDFGDSSLVFTMDVWLNTTVERGARKMRSDLRYQIDRLFRENDVVIAFPQRDVHVDGSVLVQKAE